MVEQLAVLKYYLYYKYRKPFFNRSDLKRWQKRKLKKHLAYVSKHSRIYQNMNTLKFYPIIDKTFMMKHFNRLNTVGIDRDKAMKFAVRAERERDFTPKLKKITVGLSSGTSGRRGIFLVSNQEKNRWAGYILAKFLPGSILETYSIAFFMRANSNLYEAVQSKNIHFHFFDIYHDIKEHKQRLKEIQPRILVGQPSLLLLIAEDLRQERKDIQPEIVISIAEVLEKEDEQRLKDAFGISVIHQVYQCTEGCLASTCHLGILHLNEDIVYIERKYLDDKRFIPIITDFERKAQPIIRYRLNDILVEKKESCACKNPCLALEKIEGREDDMFLFWTRDGEEKLVFPDFIRRCILFVEEAESRTAKDYRIVQETDGKITIYANLSEDERQQVQNEFEKLAKDKNFILTELSFQAYCYERGRKMKRVERKK